MRNKLPLSFYQDEDVLAVGKKLLGKKLCTMIDGLEVSAMITETESYKGPEDMASHAFGMRRTKRNEAMYMQGATSYVYLCYGMHALFNVVTAKENIPHAVLIRGILPIEGIEIMSRRMGKSVAKEKQIIGPARVTKAMGIGLSLNTCSLLSDTIWLEDIGISPSDEHIEKLERVGIEYAKEHALLPWRFRLNYSFVANIMPQI